MILDNDLTILVKDFADFRKTRRSKRQAFPEELWQRALDQARLAPPTRVARSLGLSATALTRRLNKLPKNPANTPCRIAPVKMSMPTMMSRSPMLEIIDPKGMRLLITDLDVTAVGQVVSQFMQGGVS